MHYVLFVCIAPDDYQAITGQSFNLNSVTPRQRFMLHTKQNRNERLISESRSLSVVIQPSASTGSGDVAQRVRLEPDQATVEITHREEITPDTTDGEEEEGKPLSEHGEMTN